MKFVNRYWYFTNLRQNNKILVGSVDGKINEVKGEVTIITNLATNSAPNSKLNDVKGKTLSIANVATADTLKFVENKVPNVSDLVKKVDYDAKKQKLKKLY